MFIDFANRMININYIISIYKTEISNNNYYDINIKILNNDSAIKEIYNTKEERDERFNDILYIVYKNYNNTAPFINGNKLLDKITKDLNTQISLIKITIKSCDKNVKERYLGAKDVFETLIEYITDIKKDINKYI